MSDHKIVSDFLASCAMYMLILTVCASAWIFGVSCAISFCLWMNWLGGPGIPLLSIALVTAISTIIIFALVAMTVWLAGD